MSEEEVKVLEIKSGDYIIQLTNIKLRIKSGPLLDPFLKIFGFSDFSKMPLKKSILWAADIEEIPIRSIKSISIENGKLKITWTKIENSRHKRPKETKIKLKPFQAEMIREAILRLIKGEDPQRLSAEYSKYTLGYFKVIEDEKSIVIVKDDVIEVHDPEMYKVIHGKIPLIAPIPALTQATHIYADKILIDNISKVDLIEREDREKLCTVIFKLKSGKEKKVTFKSKINAEKLVEIVETNIEIKQKFKRTTREYLEKQPIMRYEPSYDQKMRTLQDAASFLALFMIVYVVLTELLSKTLQTILLSMALALAATVILKRIRGD